MHAVQRPCIRSHIYIASIELHKGTTQEGMDFERRNGFWKKGCSRHQKSDAAIIVHDCSVIHSLQIVHYYSF